MKKILFIAIFMTMSLVAIFCQDRKDINLVPRHINTRSVSFSPEAYICQEVLYVSCYCNEDCVLYIQNSMNEIVYKSVLPGNSIEYAFCLSILDKGRFEMVLESKSWAYEGSFNI